MTHCFRYSSYGSHVLELRRKLGLMIPDVCLIEAEYPICRAKGGWRGMERVNACFTSP